MDRRTHDESVLPLVASGTTAWYYPGLFIATMPPEYIAVFVFAFLSAMIPVLALKFIRAGVAKRSARISAEVTSERRVAESVEIDRMIHFYMIAVLVVICEAAFVFLLPWAVKFEGLGVYGVMAMFAFVAVLAVGYLWIRNKGALDSV